MTKFCPSCQSVLELMNTDSEANFCSECGTDLIKFKCHECDNDVCDLVSTDAHDINFCPYCRAPIKLVLENMVKDYWLKKSLENTLADA